MSDLIPIRNKCLYSHNYLFQLFCRWRLVSEIQILDNENTAKKKKKRKPRIFFLVIFEKEIEF